MQIACYKDRKMVSMTSIHRGSYMNAHILLNKRVGEKRLNTRLAEHLSVFRIEFIKFNNIRA